jgi:hypothetical protein
MTRGDRKKPHNRRESRKTGTRGNPFDTWLIICQGSKTEPNYFRKFGIPIPSLIEVISCAESPDQIIDKAIQEQINYDKIRCVFDRDEFPPQQFNTAFEKIQNIDKIRIAYSNQSFELWYLLHFNFYDNAMHRDLLNKKLDKIMQREFRIKYAKNSLEMYNLLLKRQQTAINNAENLLKRFSDPNHNPSTTVHKLVLELNNFRQEVEDKLKKFNKI